MMQVLKIDTKVLHGRPPPQKKDYENPLQVVKTGHCRVLRVTLKVLIAGHRLGRD